MPMNHRPRRRSPSTSRRSTTSASSTSRPLPTKRCRSSKTAMPDPLAAGDMTAVAANLREQPQLAGQPRRRAVAIGRPDRFRSRRSSGLEAGACTYWARWPSRSRCCAALCWSSTEKRSCTTWVIVGRAGRRRTIGPKPCPALRSSNGGSKRRPYPATSVPRR